MNKINNIEELHDEVNFILKNLEKMNRKDTYNIIKKLIDKNPGNSTPLKLMAIVLDRDSDYSNAILILNEALKIDPNDSEIYNNIGTIFKKIKNFVEAEKFYDYAIQINPSDYNAYNNKGILLQEKERYIEALDNYNRAIKINPLKAEIYSNLGIALQLIGDTNKAIETFEKAIQIDPNLFQSYNNLANLYLYKLDYKKAEIYIKKSSFLNPKSCEVAYNYAALMYAQNEKVNAISFLEKAKLLNDKNFIYNISLNILNSNKNYNLINFDHIKLNFEVNQDWLNYLKNTPVQNIELTGEKDARFGNGLCTSDFELFRNKNFHTINIEKFLIEKLKNELRMNIYICDSFINIINKGGTTKHDHIRDHDKFFDLALHKYSLVYYLDVGDQNTRHPGILKIYDPDFEILPKNGDLLIISASRKHSSIYDGLKDRVMIGVNFYVF